MTENGKTRRSPDQQLAFLGGPPSTHGKDPALYERAVAFGHDERTGGPSRFTQATADVQGDLARFTGLPAGGCKHRMNQLCSSLGRAQLRRCPERMRRPNAP